MKNEIMLVTYADSMGRNLRELYDILTAHCRGVVGGVHVLPFYPSSADRGFAPTTYEEVDSAFGSWDDVKALAGEFPLMVDFMINHISRRSAYYADFVRNKDRSPYRDLFLAYSRFWPNGKPSQEQIDVIYKRKPRAPFVEQRFDDGSFEQVWCTFDEEQIDLNCYTATTRAFIAENLARLAQRGAAMVRLDAVAYATKRPSTRCFFLEPDVWDLLSYCRSVLEPYGVEVLPEVHEHYSLQLMLAERGYWVYDFALPMLLLHALYTGSAEHLVRWLQRCPRRQFTTLDTHDGIGVVDVQDLLTNDDIEQTKDCIFTRGTNVKRSYSTPAYQNLDIYQLNSTYYSALGNDDAAYLLARAVQFFTPGIPQVYYVGLLVGENDVELVERTKVGRDINRHAYTSEEVARNLTRPVVRRLFALMRFRNNYPAFDGSCCVQTGDRDEDLLIVWQDGTYSATLHADLKAHSFAITYFDPEQDRESALSLG